MELKRKGYEGEGRETGHEEDTIRTIVFTAGAFLLMVCLKRFLVGQWRALVFLLLNLILLAILLMSMSSASEGNDEEIKNGKIEIEDRQQRRTSEPQKEEQENEAEEQELPRLSKQELNQRVEAFIAMFREHLASDAKQAETFSFRRKPGTIPLAVEVN